MRRVYDGLRYLNLDDSRVRDQLRDTAAPAWARDVGPAVLDEAQKEQARIEELEPESRLWGVPLARLL